MGIASLREAAADLFDKTLLAVATHAHADHAGGLHEFDCRLCHGAEAEALAQGRGLLFPRPCRLQSGIPSPAGQGGLRHLRRPAHRRPRAGYRPASHVLRGCEPTRILAEGDVVDLGDRAFEVLHLPGHSPGSIGLWEAATGTLFSGDAIYDGPLLDEIPGADIAAYRATMERLLRLPVQVVHGGHDDSFGAERLAEIAFAYLRRTA